MPIVGFWLRKVGKLTGRDSIARFSHFPYKEIADSPCVAQCTMSLYFVMWLRIRVLGFGLALKQVIVPSARNAREKYQIERYRGKIRAYEPVTSEPPFRICYFLMNLPVCTEEQPLVYLVTLLSRLQNVFVFSNHIIHRVLSHGRPVEKEVVLERKAVWLFEGYRPHPSGQIPSPCCIHWSWSFCLHLDCFRPYI